MYGYSHVYAGHDCSALAELLVSARGLPAVSVSGIVVLLFEFFKTIYACAYSVFSTVKQMTEQFTSRERRGPTKKTPACLIHANQCRFVTAFIRLHACIPVPPALLYARARMQGGQAEVLIIFESCPNPKTCSNGKPSYKLPGECCESCRKFLHCAN